MLADDQPPACGFSPARRRPIKRVECDRFAKCIFASASIVRSIRHIASGTSNDANLDPDHSAAGRTTAIWPRCNSVGDVIAGTL